MIIIDKIAFAIQSVVKFYFLHNIYMYETATNARLYMRYDVQANHKHKILIH